MRKPLIIMAAAALGGCHAAPRFDVTQVRSLEQTSEGYALSFELEAANRNDFELPLLTVDYELRLDGQQVFRGRRSGEATLRREGTQLLRLPVAIPLEPGEAPPTGVTRYRLRGTVRYLTPGALARSLFDARLSRPSATFDIRGEIGFGDDDQSDLSSSADDPAVAAGA